MLVLSRRPGERIFIGDDVVITVIECAYGKTRLGIKAPREVLILREEVTPQTPLKSEVPRG